MLRAAPGRTALQISRTYAYAKQSPATYYSYSYGAPLSALTAAAATAAAHRYNMSSSAGKKRPLVSSSSSGSTPQKKRRTDPNMQKYYAVRTGMRPGVYLTWDECQSQTTGFKGASYKSFLSIEEAQAFVAGRKVKSKDDPEPPKFYAVARGSYTGIFSDWDKARDAIKGWKGPKYKKFPTREEAVDFIKQWGDAKAIEGIGEKVEEAEEEDDDSEEDEEDEVELDAGVLGDEMFEVEERSITKGVKSKRPVLEIHTDGSSRGNGRAGAAAGVGVFFDINDSRNVSERLRGPVQTNQRAELTAILRALEIADLRQPVRIVTDSQYSINCVTVWVKSWEKKDWKTSTGGDVLNQDLVKAIVARMRAREAVGSETMFKWIKGHSMNPGNEAADRLAVAGAAKPMVK
ncbi:related to ribonuclease H1 [Cephalotrichum gorgonifer]|uniref:ribonuclease H n=1 Tax=Cephalotrichum gorgonifer TaxID=2041049 RepID=A0AAE8SW46_9PEZI|nr:related to ribonuclease H1 [Cephalotrichum gorgonifer]